MAESEEYDPSKDPKRKAKSKDPGWKYAFWPDLTDKNTVQCSLCDKKMSGIKRLKEHLSGGYGDVTKCPKTTAEISAEMRRALMATKRNRPIDLDMDEDQIAQSDSCTQPSAPSLASASASHVPSSGTISKRSKSLLVPKPCSQPNSKTIAAQMRKTPEEVVDERHRKGPSQRSLEDRLRTPEEKERVHTHIANFFYECGVPFNAANAKSFEVMIESIGQYGPGLKPPTYHEIRVPLLEKAKKKTEEVKEVHKAAWKQYGCTLMSDGWTDRRGRHLINFLVNCPEGTFFMGSVDASSQSQDARMLAELLDKKIEEIGPENIVQVVTDNASNYKAAGNILMAKRPTLFWTPCAAHCLDLMLEDVGHIKQFRTAIHRAKRVTTFIYRHGRLLAAMREKTDGKDLVRAGVTRFATAFLTLQSLYKYKDPLRFLFVSDDWTRSQLSKTEAGKKVCDTVMSTQFWHQVEDCIRASQPLLIVLRIVDADERPAMPEVYAAMEVAKKKIKDAFDNKQRLYKKVIDIVERRWSCQMEQKLYGATLFLNPGKYFGMRAENPDLAFKLRGDFNDVLMKMIEDPILMDKISEQADNYDAVRDDFARDFPIRQRGLKPPIDWWNAFGSCAIELAKFAKRVLGLCCSSSGCERNWSTFEFIHTKKRNRLEHQRLSDLVYVQYNRRIMSRFQKRRELGRNFNLLILEDANWENEWVMDNPGEGLTWENIDQALGSSVAVENRTNPRRCSNVYMRRGSSSSRGAGHEDDDSDNEDEIREEDFPNDDEDVDDYGETPSPPHRSTASERSTDRLELDDDLFD